VEGFSVEFSEELIRDLPKSDIHVHLGGSMRAESLIEMAGERCVELPAETPEGLRREVFKDRYSNLREYLHGFTYTSAVLRDSDALERAAYELCLDCQEEGVRYLEVRLSPQLHTGDEGTIPTVLSAVAKGISRAEKGFNSRPGVASGKEPSFKAGIIVAALRHFTPGFSRIYKDMLKIFEDLPQDQVFGLASEALVHACVRARDELGVPVVGVDLAGREHGYPAEDHVKAYQFAHEAFLGKTVHAGEDYGPESIFQAITDCHADRIGHGTWLFETDQIQDPGIKDRQAYVDRLVQYIADRRITVEVCLTSNLQTIPAMKSLRDHPFGKMRQSRLSVALCTDNRLVSRTTVSREIGLAVEAFELTPRGLGDILIYGFKRSFYPGPYLEKRAYVRRIIDYRDEVFRRHGVETRAVR
jgi:adenosine deaminase